MKTIINTLNTITNNNIDLDLFEYGQINVHGYHLDDNATDAIMEWLAVNTDCVNRSMDADEYRIKSTDYYVVVDWYGSDI